MAMRDYFNLGSYSFPVTTNSRDTQIWFDRGLAWIYGFNHDEAAVCFRKAADSDPGCAMAYWGEAYACGTFYNMTWEQFSEHETIEATGVCYRAAQSALAHAGSATSLEQALVAALACRFQSWIDMRQRDRPRRQFARIGPINPPESGGYACVAT